MDDVVYFKLTEDQKAAYIALMTVIIKLYEIDVTDIKQVMKQLNESDENLCIKSADKIINYTDFLGTVYELPMGIFSKLPVFK